MKIPPMPMKILALAPFLSDEDAGGFSRPVQVDKDSLDQVMQEMCLSFYISLPGDLCPAKGIEVLCKSLKDFHPDSLIQNNAYLRRLVEAKHSIETGRRNGLSLREIVVRLNEQKELPSFHVETEKKKDKNRRNHSVDNILDMVALPTDRTSLSADTHSLRAQVDLLLKRLLGYVLSYDKFRQCEAVWRGLDFLTRRAGANSDILFEIASVSYDTLEESLSSLIAVLAQDPPSLILFDLPFDHSPRHIELLAKIADFSQTLLVPSVVWVTQKFLHLDTWEDLNKLPYLPHYFDEQIFAKWRRLRESPSARWLAVTCNRFLTRFPYGPDNKPKVAPIEERGCLWISPVWGLGCLLCRSTAITGWPTRFTEWKNIHVENLALNLQDHKEPLPVEAGFSEDRIIQFARAAIIPLVGIPNKDIMFTPVDAAAHGNPLSYQIFLSRISHYLLWCKDHLKKDLSSSELRENLTTAFTQLWERAGDPVPPDLEILAGPPTPEDRIPLRIVLTPSRKVLPSREKVELEVMW